MTSIFKQIFRTVYVILAVPFLFVSINFIPKSPCWLPCTKDNGQGIINYVVNFFTVNGQIPQWIWLVALPAWIGLFILIKVIPRLMKFKVSKALKKQLARWMWYNLLIFPVLMAFYIPYNLIWLQYTPLQILKFVLTNGFFGAIVNFVLRPWNAWIARFIERRNKK